MTTPEWENTLFYGDNPGNPTGDTTCWKPNG